MEQQTQPQSFSWADWLGGFVVALVGGSCGNALAIAIGFRINLTLVSLILGLVPGIFLIVLSRRVANRAFGSGLLVAACLITLLGGICGAIGTATQEGSR